MTNTVGARVAKARARMGLSQLELCNAIGIAPSTLNALEHGKGSSKHLLAIAKTLGVNVEWLTTGAGAIVGRPTSLQKELEGALRELVTAFGGFDTDDASMPDADAAMAKAKRLLAKIDKAR
jgi:transcriptional regulator with XRE-family HTH domain